jgi:drug/metabolite transporter (DMT)-like permease
MQALLFYSYIRENNSCSMLYFVLAVIFTVALYLIMRAYPRYRVHSFHAIVFNYYSCVATGLLLSPDLGQYAQVQWTSMPTLLTLALGTMFVIAFVLIGQTTQQVSVTAGSLAANMSLVIPVLFGLFIFKNANKDYTFWNYLGLVLALVALALGAIQKKNNAAPDSPATPLNWLALSLPLLTFLATGTNNTLINYLSMSYYQPAEITTFMVLSCIGAVIVGTLLLLIRILFQKEHISARSLVGGLILGVPNFLSFYFLLKALGAFGNSAAFVFPIYNILTMMASAAAAWLFFREKLNTLNRVGLILAVIAILLISYQELGLN